MAVSVGIDLCDDYTVVSRFGGSGITMMPTVICRDKKSEQWYINEEAYRMALSGKGVMTDKLLRLLKKRGVSTISGKTYPAAELMSAFFAAVLKEVLSGEAEESLSSVVVSIQTPEKEVMDDIREALMALGINKHCIRIISHAEAFIYYTLSLEKDIYNNMVALYDLSDEALSYYELKVVRGLSRPAVVSEGRRLEEAFHLDVLKNEAGKKLADGIMLGVAERLMEKKIISSVFLTGKGFEHTDWAVRFKEHICRRRKVLIEQGLFARGAAIRAEDALREESAFPYLMFCDTRLDAEISMQVETEGRQHKLILAAAGEPWYDYRAHVEFIPKGQDYVDFSIDPVDRFRKKRLLRMELKGFPKRPDRCTRVAMELWLLDAGKAALTAKDQGFGMLFPKTGATVYEEIEL